MKAFAACALGALLLTSLAGAARADSEEFQCVGGPQDKWVASDAIAAKVKQLTPFEFVIATKHNCYEAELFAGSDTVIEVFFDPVTAEVARIQLEDDES